VVVYLFIQQPVKMGEGGLCSATLPEQVLQKIPLTGKGFDFRKQNGIQNPRFGIQILLGGRKGFITNQKRRLQAISLKGEPATMY
jgi:hypothetical protein